MSGICERLGAKFPGPTRLIVFSEADLSRHLRRFADYYHRSRTHLGLEKDTPEPRPIQGREAGRIVAIPEVGGFHHQYERRAA
jgi:hypothetical protein